jgi:hypothetical protein
VIGWQPRLGVDGPWHLSLTDDYPAVSLCRVRVAGVERYVKRDPHKIDDHKGKRCDQCWAEWRMLTASSYARQDQHEADSRAFPREGRDGD